MDRHVRTRLYFTSESHLHSLLNSLRYAHLNVEAKSEVPRLEAKPRAEVGEVDEINYLTHIVIRVYE